MFAPFDSAKLLVARACHHIDEFDAAQKAYVGSKPYLRTQYIDPGTGQTIVKVRVVKPMPPELAVFTFEIVNCLRSALDHAVFDASEALGGKPKPKYTKFPCGKTARDAADDLPRKRAEVPESIRPYLLNLEPHQGGRNLIWEMNELRNGKIHQTLSAPISRASGWGFGNGSVMHVNTRDVTFVDQWDAANYELAVVFGSNAHMQVNIHVTMRVCFDKATPFADKEASPLLFKLAEIVGGIVLGIEAETARLKNA